MVEQSTYMARHTNFANSIRKTFSLALSSSKFIWLANKILKKVDIRTTINTKIGRHIIKKSSLTKLF